MNLSTKERIKLAIICLLEAISVYILVIVPLEYFLTEHLLIFRYITTDIKTYIFLAILLVISFIDYSFRTKTQFNKIFIAFILILTVGLGFGYKKYLNYYGRLQEFPRVYKISKNYGFQGTIINIEGKNFGPAWQPGEVYVKDFILRPDNQVLKFTIKSWLSDLVVIEQPVPERFFKGQLYLQKFNTKESNPKDFEIRSINFL